MNIRIKSFLMFAIHCISLLINLNVHADIYSDQILYMDGVSEQTAPYAFPLYRNLYYPNVRLSTDPKKKSGVEGFFSEIGDAIKDAFNEVGDFYKDLGESFYNKAIKPASMAIYENALIPIKNVSVMIGEGIASGEFLDNILSGDAFKDLGKFLEKSTALALIWTKNMGQAVFEQTKRLGYITTSLVKGDIDDIKKNLNQMKDIAVDMGIQTAKGLETFVKNTTAVFSNMFEKKEKPEYCAYSATTKHTNSPPTIDHPDVIQQDVEGLIPYIKKYAPISYMDKNDLYFPIWPDEYFTAPTTRVVSKATKKEYLRGKVTFEKMYELYKNCQSADDFYFEIDKCTWYGSNPAFNKDANGNLTVPLFVSTYEYKDKIYIEYIYLFALNGPYDIGPFKGNTKFKDIGGSLQNLHEFDLEHISIELDKTTKNIRRIYYGSHGRTEGFWLNANNPDIAWEGTHPIVYVAHGGHGLYPKEGTYVRIFGMANDVNVKGQRWEPANLIRVHRDDDVRFNPKTMGWLYWPGKMGAHGVGAASDKDWFTVGPQSDDPKAGDVGRDPKADPLFCKNPSGSFLTGDLDYENCLQDKVPKAGIPD